MSDVLPERIYTRIDFDRLWSSQSIEGDTEYIRADIYNDLRGSFRQTAERIAELEALVVDCMESDNEHLSEWDKKARALGLTPP